MAIFGNSNSLPISLTLSLSATLDGLEWDRIPNDTKDGIATRGILYLLIFQQLGQVLRWTWGYNHLLAAPPPTDDDDIHEHSALLDHDSDFESGGRTPEQYRHSLPSSPHSNSDMVSFPTLRRGESYKDPWTIRVRQKTWKAAKVVWGFMNAPLWAMLVSVIVAAVPALQHLFFDKGSFISNSFTSAVFQAGNVAVPLILVVLGANLAQESQVEGGSFSSTQSTRILLVSLFSRMLIPCIVLCPLIAIAARFAAISIMDDPIFVIVCFLLVGAPSAIQLAQICQINGVFEAEMARILFWSYVVLTTPSTLILVVAGIETVEWAR